MASAPEHVLGKLTGGLAAEGFDINTLTAVSWQQEIVELQTAMIRITEVDSVARQWSLLLEYVLPIIGQRLDCLLLADDLIYVIEYKGGSSAGARTALRQAQDYALNLVDFHEESRHRTVVPIAVGKFRVPIPLDLASEHQGAAVSPADLPELIICASKIWGNRGAAINVEAWNNSRYFPVPTIIEAASAVYSNHDVHDLAHSRAGSDNLETTQAAIAEAVKDAITRSVKRLIVVTGVPGAGKTLAGLNAVQVLAEKLDLNREQASFLSGNGPLVAVLQEALKRSAGEQRRGAVRSIKSRIREIHRFVRDTYENGRPPADRLIVFDEAQRAWTAAKNLKKFERDLSEPEMILQIMGRHAGWAVVVALVGGGQEIHAGEAGLAAWGDAITRHPEWEIVTSPEALSGGASVAGSRLFRDRAGHSGTIFQIPSLHLAVSKRSFESEVTAAWVNAVLDGQPDQAGALAAKGLPVYLTRDIDEARAWLKFHAKGNRRAGLVASSGAARSRAEGVETPTFKFLGGIDYVKWFLEPAGDHRSSNQLEVAMSEFEMQGLEIDLAVLVWGGDLIFPNDRVVARTL
ncbi:MAG: DUF2075 domain-containing protein [Bryobacterales bacterium]|nr:DUF2075 domain-containing protein [Bryobacterales bacterium]MBV9402060.1 DUF2075 domain-containing protein [Bryobacterales bacterium]